MEFAMVRFVICLAGCVAATYYDIFNRRNVPTWLTYSLVALGALFTLASFNTAVILQNSSVALSIFLVGYLLYRAGQIGGADVLVFVSIALLLPEVPESIFITAESQLGFPFVFSVFILSGVLGVFGIFLKYVPVTFYEILRGEKVKVNPMNAMLAFVVMLSYSVFLFYLNDIVEIPQVQLVVFAGVVLCASSLLMLREHISEKYMIRMVRVDEIDEEDILAVEKMDPKVVSKHKLDKLLTLGQIEKLKKMGKGKKFPVYKEMPVFMPYVLLALLVSLFFGDPLAYLYPIGIIR